MENIFKNAVWVKSFLFLLIVIWGGYNSTVLATNGTSEYATGIGNVLFMVFSILYILNAFFLLKRNYLGKLTYLPLVLLFVILGFVSELFSPMQIKKDFFYLLTFYIISPLFFIMQGFVLCMLMSKSFVENSHHTQTIDR